MNVQLTHRGPDGEGAWSDVKDGIALAHRRLAILDLSEAGKQPMFSASGRYVITYNGEVYNYQDLAAELRELGHSFRGHSDTEVLLAAIEQWGVERSLSRFNGMFAFAVWDREERVLWLARDRLGKKPLYYAVCGTTVLFGSQIRSLLASGSLEKRVDALAVGQLLRYGFISAPKTILHGARKLGSGVAMRIHRSSEGKVVLGEIAYWRPPISPEACRIQCYQDAKIELRTLLRDAVKVRLISDVPLGAFLSGGIDSSLITALMQASSSRPIRTFTIGFEHAEFDEADHAAAVARHLGTDHTEARFSQADLLNLVPALPVAFDEPFGDPSQLPTMLLSQLARRHVTVALSGDGGDELFGGYRRYQRFRQVWRWRAGLGTRTRACSARVLRTAGSAVARLNSDVIERLAPRAAGSVRLSQQIEKIAALLAASGKTAVYERLMSSGEQPDEFIPGLAPQWQPTWVRPGSDCSTGEFEWMMLIDQNWYLPDDILVKVDRASMFTSLEARAPLLDYRVAELAARFPEQFKIGAGVGKRILAELASEHIPRELLERPKQGFGAPIAAWLRGPLREWAEDLLSSESLKRTGLLNVAAIRQRWSSHLSNAQDTSGFLWQVLMFKSWHHHYVERTGNA
jgi:asparagine synthase (glutamine-hydrolysing)